MIEKNVVRIETLYSIGTGFMYPCKIRGGKNNSFIIITNSHILEDINENDEELMSKIYLVFYDDFGELVDKKYILSMKLCNKEWNSEVDKDIAAIFIELEDTIILSLETYVYTKKLDNREHLYMEGYIGVLYEDEICQRIQLEGIEKTIFPENKFMGVYQIADDYHWYNNYQDHKLLEGISGSPVYVNKDKHSMIVGLNQSVSNIDKGENPFKLVYYLKFEYIIEYLRKVKCIIFYKKTEFTYELEWVYRCNNNNKNELKFLLMGSSGAGKSSFAKDFAFHAEQLRSTNDGQTTRTDIVYKYSLFEKESAANVRFEGKSERTLLDNLNKNYFKYVNKWSNEKIENRKQAFLDEMSVLYIKKLDSGKPDELRMIIPCVRKEVPKAPIYCIFSGIDIFYRTDEEINNINWKKENERCPKAVRYILEEGEEELIPDKNEKSLDRNIYYVLRNNLIPYCGRKELVHNKFSYYKNNTFYIRKLLSSVAMKEYSSLEIIDLEKIKCVDDEIKLLLTSIFDLASLKSYKLRWNTVRADAESFKKNKMGYCNTYRHKFSQLFHLSYGSAIERNGYKLAEKFAPADSAVMSVLYNMEQDFLGVNSNLELINIKDGDKNEFRKILEEMYKNYDYNPFDEKFKDNDFKSNRNVIFDDIFDLKKGLQKPSPKGGTFLDNFAVYFKVVFERQIKKDNMIKADYLLKINPNFSVALEEIKREFSEKYFENNSDDMFNKIMRYHFGKDED